MPSEGGSRGQSEERKKRTLWLLYAKIAGATLSALLVAWVLWDRTDIVRPEKPQFTLQDITLYDFNISIKPSRLTSSFLVTILSHNPNAQIGIYYSAMVGYATYHNQQLTSRTKIPGTYQGHKSGDVWSVLISGSSLPVAPYIAVGLSQDWGNRMLMVMIELEGHVRWKLGSLAKGGYHITVRCPAYLTFETDHFNATSVDNNPIKYRPLQSCDVHFSK